MTAVLTTKNRLKAYCELVRLPNVFTAMADILAGACLMTYSLQWSLRLGGLLVASACLYATGIIFNDLKDIETDRKERPSRPLPSGKVSKKQARVLALVLTLIALSIAAWVGNSDGALSTANAGNNRSLIAAVLLLVAIVAYDFLLKATFVGPLIMGLCRALNLSLGMTLSDANQATAHGLEFQLRAMVILLFAIFLYVASLTYFGRDEAGAIRRKRLVMGAIGIWTALWIVGSACTVASGYNLWTFILWLALFIHMIRITWRAIRRADQTSVKYAMKTLILGLVVFDAVIASAFAGWQAGTIVLLLLVPTLTLGRLIYST